MSCALQITSIGCPTNVKHTGHASTPEEAQKLMELLLHGDGVGGTSPLPAPLKPSVSASDLLAGMIVLVILLIEVISKELFLIIDWVRNFYLLGGVVHIKIVMVLLIIFLISCLSV